MSTAVKLVSFQKLPKSMIALHVPEGVHDLVREEASRLNCSQSLALAYLICRGAEADPKEYGILDVDSLTSVHGG